MKTVSVGVRVPADLLQKAKEQDANFNLSKYVKHYLALDYGTNSEYIESIKELCPSKLSFNRAHDNGSV